MERRDWFIAGAACLNGMTAKTFRRKMTCTAESWREFRAAASALPGFPSTASFENFRRGDEKTKAYLLCGALAYLDADRLPTARTAILDFGREGCHEQNLRYYRDYVQFGRNLGQGHLFVATLPSTPLSEAAIALHLHGPARYVDSLGRWEALREAVDMHFSIDGLDAVLVFHYGRKRVLSLLALPGTSAPPSLSDLLDWMGAI